MKYTIRIALELENELGEKTVDDFFISPPFENWGYAEAAFEKLAAFLLEFQVYNDTGEDNG